MSAASNRAEAFADTNCTIFLCPDASCRLFEDTSRRMACESDCPRAAKMRKAIVCWQCKAVIKLPADHHIFCRVDCKCGAALFTRMSSRYRRMNV